MEKKKNKFESGIYNYCDRWCERCDKTQKCFLYFKEQEDRAIMIAEGKDPDDPKNAFEIVGKSLMETHELVANYCLENNIDITMTPEDEKEYEEKEEAVDPKNEPLAKISEKFRDELFDYFKTTPSLDVNEYHDAYRVMSWQGTLLGSKVLRALRSKNEYFYDILDEFSLEDSEKSAMVAYRSALKSKEALELMDCYVVDPRLQEMNELLDQIINGINVLLKTLSEKQTKV